MLAIGLVVISGERCAQIAGILLGLELEMPTCIDCGQSVSRSARQCATCYAINRTHSKRKWKCIDCGTVVPRKCKRCPKCATIAAEARKCPPNYCVDCGTEISRKATRCQSCESKSKWERGDVGGKEWQDKQAVAHEIAWQDGAYDEAVEKIKETWASQALREEDSRRVRLAWAAGQYDNNSEKIKRAWAAGAYEGIGPKRSEITRQRWKDGVYDGEDYRSKLSENMRARWAAGKFDIFFTEEYRRRLSTIRRLAWANGKYDKEAYRQRMAQQSRLWWDTGFFGDEWRKKQSEASKESWRRGAYGEEWRRAISAAQKKRWAEGRGFSKETRQKMSRVRKAAWDRGLYDGDAYRQKMSQSLRRAWANGAFDGVFRSPTSIEIALSKALERFRLIHCSQHSPEDCGFIFDEYLPGFNILCEADGDYWHSLPKAIKRDAEKDQWAAGHGYTLIRISESDINEYGAEAIVRERVLPLCEGGEVQ